MVEEEEEDMEVEEAEVEVVEETPVINVEKKATSAETAPRMLRTALVTRVPPTTVERAKESRNASHVAKPVTRDATVPRVVSRKNAMIMRSVISAGNSATRERTAPTRTISATSAVSQVTSARTAPIRITLNSRVRPP